MRMLFWFGVLLIAQAGGFVPVSGAYPAMWLYWSLSGALFGFVLLVVLREIERYREGESGRSWRRFDPDARAGDIDD